MSNHDSIAEPSQAWSTLIEVLRARAYECPERIACTFIADGEDVESHLTYGELDARARAIAVRLRERGVPWTPVLLLYPPGLDYIAGLFGCLYAGALAVPAYPPLNERQATRLQRIAADAGASLVLSTTAIIARSKQFGRKSSALPADQAFQERVPVSTFADSFTWIATDELELASAARWQDPAVSPDDLAFLQYTSGSTATPKGVMLTHRNLLHNLRSIARLFKLRPGSASVSWLPPYHDMGLIGQILEPIFYGVHTYLMSPAAFLQSPMRWLKIISRTRSEVSGGPNFAYELCARRAQPEDLVGLDLSAWRVAFNGAEPVRAETLDLFVEKFGPCGFRREAFYPCYGMAEGTLLLSGGDHAAVPIVDAFDAESLRDRRAVRTEGSERRLVSSGRVAPEHRLLIVNPDTLGRREDGEIGEIWVSGPSIAAGYWRQAELTKKAFSAVTADGDSGPFLRTGDLGFLRDGELFVVGRLKDLIILRGRNLHPEDIELTVARSHPDVRASSGAAFAVELAGEERLVIVQEIARRPSGTCEEILRAVRRSVAEEHGAEVHAVVFLQVGTVPKTSSGKIQRHACKEAFLAGALREVFRWTLAESVASGNDAADIDREPATQQRANTGKPSGAAALASERIVEWLTAWIAKHSGVRATTIARDEPFVAFGLASVDVVRLATDLEQWLGRRLSPVLPYQYPTIQTLAAHLAGDSAGLGRPQTTGLTHDDEPIAIVGLSCRFPGAADPEAYWRLLQDGVDAVSEQPQRWALAGLVPSENSQVARTPAGFLETVDTFDADFFGISPREAAQMDPQQRLLLEVAVEAMERAGHANVKGEGRRVGVFVGVSTSDYAQLMVRNGVELDAYSGTGTALSIVANRLSYQLDLQGPSVAVDTACSSSLVAVHWAVRSLRRGECDAALAGGVNLLLSPDPTIVFSHAQMMAKRGRCRTFDAGADGYVRGEGCGVLVLKRLSDALASHDHIVAVIRGSAINQDGRSNGLTAPNGLSQQAVIREALADAGWAPADIDYVEAHGTGTPLGDPIEMEALKAVLLENRPAERRCAIGSVKTNLGHLEAAAGVAGLIKTALSLQHARIPAHLHLERLNPAITLEGAPLFIPQETLAWSTQGGPRRAGVSSFGFGGTNCHVVLEEAPPQRTSEEKLERPAHLFTLSARTEEALKALAMRFAGALVTSPASLPDICFSANAGRMQHEQRLAISARTLEELTSALRGFAAGERVDAVLRGVSKQGTQTRIAFLFTGQGSQYPGMGRELFDSEPVFRQELERCDTLLRPLLEVPLLEVLYGEPSTLLDQTAYTQPALFALEWATACLWRSWGIEPRAVMGHSVGEYVAACVAGVFSLEDGLRLIATRARLMQALPLDGAMAALRCSEEVARSALESSTSEVSIAAVNGPQEVVISGVISAVEKIRAELQARGVESQRLNVSHAFHSPLMEPILEQFEAVAKDIQYRQPELALISNLTGSRVGDEICTAAYWRRHLREPVRFAQGLNALFAESIVSFVEVGPAPILSALARRISPESGRFVPSLRRGKSDCSQMLQALGELYVQGALIDWRGFEAGRARHRIVLPTYPFERQRHWFKPGRLKRVASALHPLLGDRVPLAGTQQVRFDASVGLQTEPCLHHHRVFGEVVFPAAAFIEMALASAAAVAKGKHVGLEKLSFRRALILSRHEGEHVQTVVSPPTSPKEPHRIEIYSRTGLTERDAEAEWVLNASASVRMSDDALEVVPLELEALLSRCGRALSAENLYARFELRHLDYGPGFRGVEELYAGDGTALGRIRVPEASRGVAGQFRLHPVLLDACFHVIGAAFIDDKERSTWLPMSVENIRFSSEPGEAAWSYVEVRHGSASERIVDVSLLHVDGRLIAELRGLHLRPVERRALLGEEPSIDGWFYETEWRPRTRRGRQLSAEYLPSPQSVLADLKHRVESVVGSHSAALKSYPVEFALLEGLAFGFAARALAKVGWQPRVGERFTAAALAQQLGVVPKQRRLWSRLLEMMAEEGIILQADAESYRVVDVTKLGNIEDPTQRILSCRELLPNARHELTLLERTAEPLAEVLTGRVDPLTLLFPNGDLSTVTAIYQDTPGAEVLNRTAAEGIARALKTLPSTRTLRVLEVGAGTGATTAHVLPTLPTEQTEYVFTDVSPAFLTHAKRKFAEYRFLEFSTFDVEKEPTEQGFQEHSFDLIIASNVLHATADLAVTLEHLRKLLVDNGVLVVSEVTRRVRWLDLTFGLAEGWWRFRDAALRSSYPLLSETQWAEVLGRSGFGAPFNLAEIHAQPSSMAPTAVLFVQAAPARERSAIRSSDRGAWLIVCESVEPRAADHDFSAVGQELADLLSARGERAIFATVAPAFARLAADRYTIARNDSSWLPQIIQDLGGARLEGIVLFSDLYDAATANSTESHGSTLPQDCGWAIALDVVQSLAKATLAQAPSLWLITRGASGPGGKPIASGLWQSPLWGMGRTLQLEHPEMRCRLIDLDPAGTSEAQELVNELLADDWEQQLAFRDARRFAARLIRCHDRGAHLSPHRLSLPADVPPGSPFRLKSPTSGTLSELALRPFEPVKPDAGAVQIEIRATGLNFRDVLNAMGLYPGEAGPLGCDTAGVVIAVGEGVEHLRVGDEVIAIATGTLGTHVTVDAAMVVQKPKNLSFEEAATVPVAFVTAYYALHHAAKVASGDRVLIHAATGGVGQAAIQLVRRAGAEVYATASPSKWHVLEELGVTHRSSSRSDVFVQDVLAATDGQGVDVVLNSLAGDLIERGLATLAPNGRFIEIGKTTIWSPAQIAERRSDVAYSVLDLPELCAREPIVIQSILRDLVQAFEDGSLRPIPLHAFPIQEVAEAFRVMQRAEHVGKLVITLPERAHVAATEDSVSFSEQATYLITGGLGDLGLLVARWMIERGARHLLLLSRRECGAEEQAKLRELERIGGQPRFVRADVSNFEQLAAAIQKIDTALPLKGVVHAAGVLDDSLLLQQDPAKFRRVLAPKMLGAWNLHRLTEALELDFFMLFASVAGLLGSSGQANHAAANTFLDSLAHYRRSLGLPATSIDWGIWSELGAAARKGADTQGRFKAMGNIPPSRGLEALERVFAARAPYDGPQIAIVPIEWRALEQQTSTVPFLSDFRLAVGEEKPAVDAELLKRIQESPLHERRAILEERLSAQVAQVLGWGPDRVVDTKQGFFDTGMDSLTSLELRNLIQRSFGCALPSTVAFDYPTIEALAGYLMQEVPALSASSDEAVDSLAAVSPSQSPVPPAATASLSPVEVRQMLDQKLMSIEALLGDSNDEAEA
ncbi:MAG: SDR family NAD(P)-dependent oxidoreductase [Myxococcota bacterium]